MIIPDDKEQLQNLAFRYLYDDLSAAEIKQFEAAIESNAQLRDVLEAEKSFDSTFPVGTHPLIDDDRIEGNRWLLRQNLQKQNRARFSFSAWLQDVMEKPFTVALQGAAMAATFVLGIIVATPSTVGDAGVSEPQLVAQQLSPLELINDEDFEIFELKVNNYDAVSGDIDLSFSLASETHLTGNVADQNIHGLMAVALKNDIDSAARLDTINALQPVASGSEVSQALIHVLMNDDNAGVRYQAALSLVQLTQNENVRDALRYALSTDVNEGVRVQAFQALVNYTDEQTLAVFRQKMNEDSNEFIRAQARNIVQEAESVAIEI